MLLCPFHFFIYETRRHCAVAVIEYFAWGETWKIALYLTRSIKCIVMLVSTLSFIIFTGFWIFFISWKLVINISVNFHLQQHLLDNVFFYICAWFVCVFRYIDVRGWKSPSIDKLFLSYWKKKSQTWSHCLSIAKKMLPDQTSYFSR